MRVTSNTMKWVALSVVCIFLAACASEPAADSPESNVPTKADIKNRDDFARTLPKPPER
jgi:outer membrane biogenesis lipoprotein LolB